MQDLDIMDKLVDENDNAFLVNSEYQSEDTIRHLIEFNTQY